MAQAEPQATLIERFRGWMPIAPRYAYFDHAAVAPLPAPTRTAMSSWLDEATFHGDTSWPQWSEKVRKLRTQAAQLIGAQPSEIALVANTTTGLGIVAEGWPWREGENVVTLANEFPSNLYPWLNLAGRGVETRMVPVDGGVVDLDRLAERIDERTRIVSVSWVGYASGWRLNLVEVAELCRRKNVRLMVDAIQGLGVFPVDVEALGIDFLAADGHKWLLGPEGAGILYVRRELQDRLRTIGVGWNSVQAGHDFGRVELKLRPDAARWEGGSTNMAGMLGLQASMEMLLQLGVGKGQSPVADAVLAITDYLVERLREAGAEILSPRNSDHRSGIVTFVPRTKLPLAEVRSRLIADGVVVSCRGGGIRAAPHGYNNRDDVERLITGLLKCD
jgi:cysteine desulfurase / selenocysteine lyase